MSASRRPTASLSELAPPRRAKKAAPVAETLADGPKRGDLTEGLDLVREVEVAKRPEPRRDEGVPYYAAPALSPIDLPEPELEFEPEPEPEPEPPAPVASRVLPVEVPARAEEIVVYWERLRRGRPFPPVTDIDRSLVGSAWPDSLIVAFEGGDTAMPRISRLGATDGAIEYTPMVTDWILTRARHAAKRATKLDETQTFPIEGDTPRYRMLLMPLGASNGASDCVLCHLCRAA